MLKRYNIFSSSDVNFYIILSHVLDSDSEILKMLGFFVLFCFIVFFKNLSSSHHLKGHFLPGGRAPRPL